MSKAELFKMHVYMCVCLYRDIILLIYYSCCRSLFKTSLYLFLWKYSSRKITDLSPCPFQWLFRSLFVTPRWASVQFRSLCHEWTASWRAWFILMVLVVGTSETCCTTPISFLVSALALPCGDDREQRHQDDPWPPGGRPACLLHWHRVALSKAFITPQWAEPWDLIILLAIPAFWGSKSQRALLIKNRWQFNWNEDTVLDVQKFDQALNLPLFSIWCSLFERCAKFLNFWSQCDPNKAHPSLPSSQKNSWSFIYHFTYH